MAKKLKTTPKVVAMLEVGVTKETFLDRLLEKSREFGQNMMQCLSQRLRLIDLTKSKYMPLEKQLRLKQAKLYDNLILRQPPEVCQESAKEIEEVEREMKHFDIMDKAPVLEGLKGSKSAQIRQAHQIVDDETKNVVEVEREQLHGLQEDISKIYRSMEEESS